MNQHNDNVAGLRLLKDCIALWRSGQLDAAIARIDLGIIEGQIHPGLHALAGMIHCQRGALEQGIPHLRAALDLEPADLATASNLAHALIESGRHADAANVLTAQRADEDPSMRLWRLRAYALQEAGDLDAAIAGYRRIADALPEDFEAWNNLGNVLATANDHAGSIVSLEKARALRPDVAPIRLNLATSLMHAGRADDAERVLIEAASDFPQDAKPLGELSALMRLQYRDPEALDAMEQAALRAPRDPELQVRLGGERSISQDHDGARKAFDRAIEIDPTYGDAHVKLALLLDRSNDVEALAPLVVAAETRGVDEDSLNLIRALILRRTNRFDEALSLLATLPDTLEPERQAQWAGEMYDQREEGADALDAFERLNALFRADPSDPMTRAAIYRQGIATEQAKVTDDWYRQWSPPSPTKPGQRSPVFLVGFPRSGTTLLDTILMGHPRVEVLEERPPLRRAEEALGGFDRLARLTETEIDRLREVYFEAAAREASIAHDSILVDKFPLHMNKVPLIHRLFPDAHFILALRHPLDVVLSCVITSFRLNNAMANFLTLDTAAETYDLSFSYWQRARQVLPIAVTEVRYERLIVDPESELRPVFEAMGLDWNPHVLDHQATVQRRGSISTASYAQVAEPLYRRASGRWQRYRDFLEPVLPRLSPWVSRLGYNLN